MFGTIWFSSILFISAGDALGVWARYAASAIICRTIMMYELAGMRETTTVDEKEEFEMINSGRVEARRSLEAAK